MVSSNLIENFIKVNDSFVELNYTKVCFDYINNDNVRDYRKRIQCFRHASEKSLKERNSFTNEQKMFLVDYGILALKSINEIKKQKLHTN